jgi:choice-of-anchor C domain-containing protein
MFSVWLFAQLVFAAHAQKLLNVDFCAHLNWSFTNKVGPAAVGHGPNDFWNLYSRDDGSGGFLPSGSVIDLKWADGTVSPVDLAVANAPGMWFTDSADPMFQSYLYPLGGGDMTVALTELPAGAYDLYFYAHGQPDGENGVVQVTCNGVDYGTKSTTTSPGWNTTNWQAGQQYVLFENVAVSSQPLVITVKPGSMGLAVMNGMQLLLKPQTPPPGPENLADNGSFELPPGISRYRVFAAGSDLPGWTVEQGTVEIVGPYWQAVEGVQSLDLNGTFEDIGTISQEVVTVPGRHYKVRFAYAGNPEGGPTVKTTKVFWNDTVLAEVSFDTTGRSLADMGWVYYEYEVTATSANSRLKFQSATPTFCGPALDDVSITLLGEPPPPPQCVPAPAGLVAWWRDEGTMDDAAGGNPGVPQNGAGYTAGKVGQGMLLDGVDDEVLIPASPGLNVQSFTVETWINPTDVSAQRPVIEWCAPNDWAGVHLWISVAPPLGGSSVAGTLYANVRDVSDGNHVLCSAPGLISADQWSHVALTYAFATGRGELYLNGASVAAADLGQFIPKTQVPLHLGRRPISCLDYGWILSPFAGLIDEISLYSRALSAAEIQAVFAAGSAGKCPPTPPPQCVPAPAGLVAWWQAEGNTDDSAGANDGNPENGGGYAAGKVGQAFRFAGGDQVVRVPASAGLDVGAGEGLTIEGWIKPDHPTAIGPLVEWNDPATSRIGAHFWINAAYPPGSWHSLFANLLDTQGQMHIIDTGTGLLTAGSWHHVAVSYDKGSGAAALYLDGVAVQTQNLGVFTPATSYDLWFGRRVSGDAFLWSYQGLHDEFSLYRRALSAAEVQALHAAGSNGKCPPPPPQCVPAPAGLVAWWRGEGDLQDAVGGHRGALFNGASPAPGKVGQGIAFDGIDDYATIPFSPAMTSRTFSVETWIKPLGPVDDPTFGQEFIFGQALGSPALLARPSANGIRVAFAFAVNWAASLYPAVEAAAELPFNENSHVAGTWDGTTLRIYVNGVLSGESVPGYVPTPATCDFFVGGHIGSCNGVGFSGGHFNGVVDELSLYNRSLTAQETQSVFTAGNAGKCPPTPPPSSVVADWTLEEGLPGTAVTSVVDASGNGHVGSIIYGNPSFAVSPPSAQAHGNVSLALGSNSGFRPEDSVAFNFGDAFTLEAQIMPGDNNEGPWGRLLISGFNPASGAIIFGLGYRGEDHMAVLGDITAPIPQDRASHHLAAVYSRPTLALYLDGQLAGTMTYEYPFPPAGEPSRIAVGCDYNGGFWFGGLIDRVRISNRALPPSEFFVPPGTPDDEQAPVVTITSPAPGPTENELVQLSGTVTDNVGVASVRLEWDGPPQTPLELNNGQILGPVIRLHSGENRFRVIATDAAGNEGSAEVLVTWTRARILFVVNPDERQEGQKVHVPIRLISYGDVGGLTFTLRYNAEYLRPLNFEWIAPGESSFKQVNLDVPGEIRATFALMGTAIPAGTQSVAMVVFRALSVPATLTTELPLELVDVSDVAGNPIGFGNRVRSGVAPIRVRRIVGDNNANQRLDTGDATAIQRLLAALDPMRNWDRTGNDVNQNTQLDSGDVVRVLRVVVGLDPQPVPAPAGKAKPAATTFSAKDGPGSVGSAVLSADVLRGQPGDRVKVQVRLQDIPVPLSGAAFTLEYSTNALRLMDRQSHRLGALVAGNTLAMWNVAPPQNDYRAQPGRVSLGLSSATAWPESNGVLAEFTFEIQPGQSARHCWPVRLTGVEITSALGLDVYQLTDAQVRFIGRDPVRPDLEPPTISASGDRVQLRLLGEADVTYVIEASSNLTDWAPIGTVESPDGVLNFSDPAIAGSGQRFYRLRQQ